MDPPEKMNLSIDQLFDQPAFSNRLFFNARELSEHLSEKDYLDFNIEESINNFINISEMPLPQPLQPDECHSIRNHESFDDTNHLDDLEEQKIQNNQLIQPESVSQRTNIIQMDEEQAEPQGEPLPPIDCQKLQQHQSQSRQIINYLVDHSNCSRDELHNQLLIQFGAFTKSEMVLDLVQKFTRLKKTKQQLIKYCMRKAFKFILQLPKNKHLLQVNKQQKFSFSKCKNRFLKKVSEEKSMNNKFLQQIFHEKDFSEDYLLFLKHFEQIMQEDNEKKIKYLAELLTVNKEGKVKNVEMVRRLPWTKIILERVDKISKQLLKYSGQK